MPLDRAGTDVGLPQQQGRRGATLGSYCCEAVCLVKWQSPVKICPTLLGAEGRSQRERVPPQPAPSLQGARTSPSPARELSCVQQPGWGPSGAQPAAFGWGAGAVGPRVVEDVHGAGSW